MTAHVAGDPALAARALATRVLAALTARRETLATAESLTAGLVSATLAEVSGASAVLRGGVTAYATDVKTAVLGVDPAIVAEHGVVSAACARDMARAARELFDADWAVSTTGVAGPDTQEGKPVGAVFVGVSGATGTRAIPLALAGSRDDIRRGAARGVLAFLAEALAPDTPPPMPSSPPEAGVASASSSASSSTSSSTETAAAASIPVKAYGLVVDRTRTRHAVWRGNDPSRQPTGFHRLLGGHVEFGEHSSDAVVRELAEELGVSFANPRLLATIENVFGYDGRPGHEIAFVYAGEVDAPDDRPADPPMDRPVNQPGDRPEDRDEDRPAVVPSQGGWFADVGGPIWVEWRRLDGVGETLPLYPEGLQDVLDSLLAAGSL